MDEKQTFFLNLEVRWSGNVLQTSFAPIEPEAQELNSWRGSGRKYYKHTCFRKSLSIVNVSCRSGHPMNNQHTN